MAFSKVILNGTTLMDVTDVTAGADEVLNGYTVMANNGIKYSGHISSLSAQTYTPTTVNQYIGAQHYLSGSQTILGDANLLAGNIKKDVSIFGVTGTYDSGGGSSYTLAGSTELSVSTTSTSRTIELTWSMPLATNKMYLITVRDKAGKRTGYHYGSDCLVSPGLTDLFWGIMSYYVDANGDLKSYKTVNSSRAYGVCAYTYVSATSSIRITSQYNATYTGTINGTFKVNAYQLDYPTGESPF